MRTDLAKCIEVWEISRLFKNSSSFVDSLDPKVVSMFRKYYKKIDRPNGLPLIRELWPAQEYASEKATVEPTSSKSMAASQTSSISTRRTSCKISRTQLLEELSDKQMSELVANEMHMIEDNLARIEALETRQFLKISEIKMDPTSTTVIDVDQENYGLGLHELRLKYVEQVLRVKKLENTKTSKLIPEGYGFSNTSPMVCVQQPFNPRISTHVDIKAEGGRLALTFKNLVRSK